MKLIIDIPDLLYYHEIEQASHNNSTPIEKAIAQGKPYEERPQGDLADEVWKLYKKHQSHLATYVLEFGEELADLLGKYNEGGAE